MLAPSTLVAHLAGVVALSLVIVGIVTICLILVMTAIRLLGTSENIVDWTIEQCKGTPKILWWLVYLTLRYFKCKSFGQTRIVLTAASFTDDLWHICRERARPFIARHKLPMFCDKSKCCEELEDDKTMGVFRELLLYEAVELLYRSTKSPQTKIIGVVNNQTCRKAEVCWHLSQTINGCFLFVLAIAHAERSCLTVTLTLNLTLTLGPFGCQIAAPKCLKSDSKRSGNAAQLQWVFGLVNHPKLIGKAQP